MSPVVIHEDPREVLLLRLYYELIADRLQRFGLPPERASEIVSAQDLPPYVHDRVKSEWLDECRAVIERAIEREIYWWPWTEIA